MKEDLVTFWERCNLSKSPFAHPDDHDCLGGLLSEKSNRANFGLYIGGDRFHPDNKSLHLSLLPVPYAGDLKKTEVVVLLLNPGFQFGGDFWAEYKNPDFLKRLKRNLRQRFNKGEKFPFMFLDPKFCWSPGFQWWERKLRGITLKIAEAEFKGRKDRYFRALSFLSQHLACLELFPYHSSSFRYHKPLPSVQAAKEYAQGYLVRAAKSGSKTVIVARGGWGIEEDRRNNIWVYGSKQAQGAHLGPETEGGKAILAALAKAPTRDFSPPAS